MVDHRQSPRGADFYPSSTSSSSSNAPASSPHLSAHPPHPHAHRQQQTSPMPSNLNHHQVARNNSLAPQASHNPEFHQQQQQQRSNSYSHSTPNYNSSPSMSFSAPNTDTLNAYRARPVAPPRGGEGGAARDVRPSPRLSQQQPGMLSSNPSSSSDQASAYSTGSGDRGGGGTSEMGGNASTSSGQDPRLNGQSGHPSMPTGMTYQPSGGFVGQQGSRGAFPSMQESTGGDGHSNAYYSQSPYQQQQQSSTSTYPQNQYQSHPSQEMYSPVSTSGSHSNPSHPSHQASYAAYPATGGHGNGQPQPSSSHPHSSNQQLPPTPTQSDAPVPGQTPESRGTKRKSSAGQETHPQQQPPLPTNPQSNYNYSDTASSSASSAYGHPPAPSYGGGGYSAYPAHLYPSGTAPGTGGGPSGSPYGLPYPSFGGGYGAYPSDPRSQAQGMGGGDPAQSQRTSVGSNSSDPGGMAGMVAHQQQQQQQNQLQFQQHHPGNPYYGYNYGAYAHPQGSHPNPQMRYPQQFHPSDPHSYHSQHNLLATPDYGYGRVAPGTFGAPRPNKPPPPAKPAPKARSASISKPKKSPPPPPASKAPSKSQLNPPKKSPSAWQLYFADDLSEYKSKMKEGDKLNVANVAKEAAVRYKVLDEKKKVAYRTRAEELKLGWDKEMAAWKETLSPKDIAQENAFRAAQRKAGKSRKSNIKDPNAPQKPLSAYFLFLRKIRADKELQKEIFQNEHETTKQSVLAASRWRSMTAEEKTPFLAQAELDKIHYDSARRQYDIEKGLIDPSAPPPPKRKRTHTNPGLVPSDGVGILPASKDSKEALTSSADTKDDLAATPSEIDPDQDASLDPTEGGEEHDEADESEKQISHLEDAQSQSSFSSTAQREYDGVGNITEEKPLQSEGNDSNKSSNHDSSVNQSNSSAFLGQDPSSSVSLDSVPALSDVKSESNSNMASNHQESEENQSLNLDFDALDHLGMEMNVNGITFDLSDIQPGNPQNNHFMSENSGPEGNKNQAQIQIQHQDFTTNEGLEDEILDSFSSSEGEETSEIPSATLSNEVSSASMVSSDQATQHQKNAEESSSAIQG